MSEKNRFETVDVAAEVNASPFGRFQLYTIVVSALLLAVDGFDTQAMGYVAPAILADWGISKSLLGPVFSSGLFGMLIGSLMLGILADRIGRKPVIISGAIFFGVCSLITARVHTIPQLEVIRFLAGLGLGGIFPNAISLCGEYTPKRLKMSVMMWVGCGFTAGAAIGGFASAGLIHAFGWRSVFQVGGIAPILLALVVWASVPESMQYLVTHGKKLSRVADCLKRITGSDVAAGAQYKSERVENTRFMAVVRLFKDGQARTTILIWVANFVNLMEVYFLASWLPTIVKDTGMSTTQAVLVGAVLQAGGVLGTATLGPIIDRVGHFRVLVPCYLFAIVMVALIGQPWLSVTGLFVVVGLSGYCIAGGQSALNALSGYYYRTSERSTGVGWGLGIGRLGSVIGPFVGGLLIQSRWPLESVFLAYAIPPAICAFALLLMAMEWRSRKVVERIA
jgi:AAHS family 4-hydroxybenzoate transporter-like MFS transporter